MRRCVGSFDVNFGLCGVEKVKWVCGCCLCGVGLGVVCWVGGGVVGFVRVLVFFGVVVCFVVLNFLSVLE